MRASIEQVDNGTENQAELEEIKTNLGFVFESHMQGKLMGVPEAQQQAVIAKHLPILADALRRGRGVVFTRLQAGEFSFKLPQFFGVRRYTAIGESKVAWEVVADSEDPFQSLEFEETFARSGLESKGVINPYADSFIVDAMVREGLSQQGFLQNRFLNTYNQINQLIINDRGDAGGSAVLNHLSSHTVLMGKYLEVYNRLMGLPSLDSTDTHGRIAGKGVKVSDMREVFNGESSRAKPLSEGLQAKHREVFVEQVLLGEDSGILDDLPLIEEQCTQINQLIQLFVGPQGIVGNNRRDEYEDSLAVELIVNPGQFVGNVKNLRVPRTNADSLYRLGQLLQQVTESSQDKRPEVVTQLIKTVVISTVAPILTPLFREMGIGKDLGLEYLDALLSNAIPGFIKLGLSGMSLDHLQRRRDFNLRFVLSGRIGKKSPSGNENRLDDILASLRDIKIIRTGRLLGASDAEAQSLFEQIFNGELLLDRVDFERASKLLMNDLRMIYNPNQEGFVITPVRKMAVRESYTRLARQYLAFGVDRIQAGEIRTVDFFEKRVVKQLIEFYYKQHGLPLTAEEFVERLRQERQSPDHTSREDKLAAQEVLMAARCIAAYFRDEDFRLPTLDAILKKIVADNRITPNLPLPTGRFVKKSIYSKPKDNSFGRAKSATEDLLDDVRRSVFGGGNLEDRQLFLVDKLTGVKVGPYISEKESMITFNRI